MKKINKIIVIGLVALGPILGSRCTAEIPEEPTPTSSTSRSLPFIDSDGVAELTGTPIAPFNATAGKVVDVTLLIDGDTGYVAVDFFNPLTGTYLNLGCTQAIASMARQKLTLNCTLPVDAPNAEYVVWVYVAPSDVAATGVRTYLNNNGSPDYWIKDESGVSVDSGVVLTKVTTGGSSYLSEGNQGVPVALTVSGMPYTQGTIAKSVSSSFYRVSGLTIGKLYTVSISAMTVDVDLDVFTGGFATWVCGSGNIGKTSEGCSFTASTTSIDVEVSSWWDNVGGTFTLNVI